MKKTRKQMILLVEGAGARHSANVATATGLRAATTVRSIQADGLGPRSLGIAMDGDAARRNGLRHSRERVGRARGDQRLVSTVQQNLGNQAVQRFLHPQAIQTERVSRAPGKKTKSTYDMGSPVSNATETFYDISEPKLAKVHKKFKFKDAQGNKLAGETKWKVGVNAIPKGGVARKGKWYVLDPIPWTVQSMVVTLPKWTKFAKARAADKKEWARFIKRTRIHEQGHVKRTRDYMSNKIPAKWKKARASASLSSRAAQAKLEREVARLGAKIEAKLKQISDAYDKSTGHGATQKATLKPPP
jgi:hypothetical protein